MPLIKKVDINNFSKDVVIRELSALVISQDTIDQWNNLVPSWTNNRADFISMNDYNTKDERKLFVIGADIVPIDGNLTNVIDCKIPCVSTENTTLTLKVTNYDGTNLDTTSYDVNCNVSDGSVSISTDTISWTLPSVSNDYLVARISVWITDKSSTTKVSNVVNREVTINK